MAVPAQQGFHAGIPIQDYVEQGFVTYGQFPTPNSFPEMQFQVMMAQGKCGHVLGEISVLVAAFALAVYIAKPVFFSNSSPVLLFFWENGDADAGGRLKIVPTNVEPLGDIGDHAVGDCRGILAACDRGQQYRKLIAPRPN